MDCPFCQIISNDQKERVLDENEMAVVILSNPRLMPGHILVIPKKHVERLSQLAALERSGLLEMAIKWQELIIEKLAPGCDLRQNYRPFIPSGRIKVNHLHFHLLPRSLEDELYRKSMTYEKELFQDLTSSEMGDIVNRLRGN